MNFPVGSKIRIKAKTKYVDGSRDWMIASAKNKTIHIVYETDNGCAIRTVFDKDWWIDYRDIELATNSIILLRG